MQPFFRLGLSLGAAVLLSSSSAFAVSIFNDTFSDPPHAPGLAVSLPNWTYLAGNVDVVNNTAWPPITCVGSASGDNCLDTDGTPGGNAVVMRTAGLSLVANGTYTLTFWVSGNQRTGTTDTLAFGLLDSPTLGGTPVAVNSRSISGSGGSLTGSGASGSVSIVGANGVADWRMITLTFNAASTGTAYLTFDATGGGAGDQIGLMLDDVNLDTPIPEPTSLALIGTGLVLVGLRFRRS